jgi:hypothetical protein
MSDTPAWLKAMENGGLGEARAKAFLMDRFWVLERSVDIEGADYLVQRKLTNRNFMDHDPPRLGVVQVKYIQDGGTAVSLHKNYVCDADGNPYGEFFLLVFTGREDKKKSYLLSAAEVKKEFVGRTDDKGRVFLRIGGANLMATSNYEVLQEKRALDKIERALAGADFYSNRRFLVGTSYLEISPEHIDADLLAPLDNPYGNLQELFFQEKQKVRSILWDMEELTDAMHKMLASTDPEEAFRLYEEAIAGHVGGDRRITFSSDFFRDSDFEEAVKRHRFRRSRLRGLGVEGAFFKLLETYAEALTHWLTHFDPSSSAAAVKVTTTYDVDSLRDPVVVLVAEDTVHRTPHVEHSKRGQQILFLDLARLKREIAQAGIQKERSDIVRESLWTFTRPFESALDEIYIGDSP